MAAKLFDLLGKKNQTLYIPSCCFICLQISENILKNRLEKGLQTKPKIQKYLKILSGPVSCNSLQLYQLHPTAPLFSRCLACHLCELPADHGMLNELLPGHYFGLMVNQPAAVDFDS